MKKLLIILFLLLISCGGSYQKAEMAAPEDDSISLVLDIMDSLTLSYQETVSKSIAIDSPIVQPETLSVQKDTIKKPSSRKIVQTKLDTVSNLPMIRKNMEVINYQQKQLDSLLSKKKK